MRLLYVSEKKMLNASERKRALKHAQEEGLQLEQVRLL